MKKNLLIAACVFLTLSNAAFSAETPNAPTNAEIKQKACQNVFSFINIDLSVMSPRAAGNEMTMVESRLGGVKGAIEPIGNITPCKCDCKNGQNEIKPVECKIECPEKPFIEPPPPMPSKNRTSLFRLDLLHIFKIQIQ